MALRGEVGWDAAMAQEFGQDRWAALRPALQRDVEHVCYVNQFLAPDAFEALEATYALQPTHVPGAFSFDVPQDSGGQYRVLEHEEDSVLFVEADQGAAGSVAARPAPMLSQPSLPPFLFMEGSAVIAALALQASEGETVLDACAAPGGKSIVLASAMFGASAAACREPHGMLVCNEVSKARAARMQRSVRAFLPPALCDGLPPHGPFVAFTAADMGTPVNSMEKYAPYDKILLDAPCNVDRELLRGRDEKLARWSAGTVKVSAQRQLKLLRNALWMLKEGGVLLFCSRALAGGECDEVVDQLLVQERDRFELRVLPVEEEIWRMVPNYGCESTGHGVRILPDVGYFGPAYISRIQLVQRRHPDVGHIPDVRRLPLRASH